jgi:alpha-L-fucosidase 2
VKKIASSVFLLMLFLLLSAENELNPRIHKVWDDHPALNRGADFGIIQAKGYPYDADWEGESYPIGNGYMGANVFGRTDMERIQITEKTLANEGLYGFGGLTNFAEIYLELNHHNPKSYRRALNLNEGILYLDYTHAGVRYSREYVANYPENIIAVKLSSNEKGKLSFTLTVEIPYRRSANEINTRTGKTFAENDVITLSGNIAHFNVNYEAQIKVINEGGELIADNDNPNAQIRVVNADSVVLLIAAGTNYRLSEDIFLERTNNKKLDRNEFPHEDVSKRIDNAADTGYEALKQSHLRDYQELYSRATVNLVREIPSIPTRKLLEQYQKDPSNPYLEELMFHFGRYLLISSSREGTLPCGLQGVWSQYAVTPWTGGFWHNINVQMNYWCAFNTDLIETFTPYLEFYEAYRPEAEDIATRYVERHNPEALDEEGDNGWAIGVGSTPYVISRPGGHSGPGTGGFTAKLLWDRYAFTQDKAYLRKIGYPALLDMSKFLSKTLTPAEDGKLLANPSASPEVRVEDDKGEFRGPHYVTVGTTFDQGFIWETYNDLLTAADILDADDPFLDVVRDQIDKLDPILIGASGQIKEYREEQAYADIGDPHHRHISHLCPLFPGTLINANQPDWIQAAAVTLDLRGNEATGWGLAHRLNLRARTKDGPKAHEVLSILLKERTLPNLWSIHPPFQIDANLGLVAGMAEMLMQSHEGFIDLLPALPETWKTGSFKGLVARGNFEVDASWQDQRLEGLRVISRSGAKCTIKYPDIDNARITDAQGNPVAFTKDDEDLISFRTEKLRSYTITLNQ